eukprot:TRINITY_DN18567_c0_g2_i1.p1 TRINITY_DN18567_c0_g2~~TRINITY_DN18567_c0_g2_i1.p1  ORF type:complete len:316 (+),score=33.61 TRINITY_DN18567_c0_g2_i1:44-991(+)
MSLRLTGVKCGTAWRKAVQILPEAQQLDHGPDQYGVQKNFSPEAFSSAETEDGVVYSADGEGNNGSLYHLTKGLSPPTTEKLYSPMREPFLVPPKYRNSYDFSNGHGRYLYSKDPLWMEARERYWQDLHTALHVHRRNYQHLRKVYQKQYQDADRYNLDEYLSVMNRVKRDEAKERERLEENDEKDIQDNLHRLDAIEALKTKRSRIYKEDAFKRGVWEFEQYTEQLQYMTETKTDDFITLQNMEEKIEHELDRWLVTSGTRSRLNMFGRIPYQETAAEGPRLEVQYTFLQEDLSNDGREAFRRLVELSSETSSC